MIERYLAIHDFAKRVTPKWVVAVCLFATLLIVGLFGSTNEAAKLGAGIMSFITAVLGTLYLMHGIAGYGLKPFWPGFLLLGFFAYVAPPLGIPLLALLAAWYAWGRYITAKLPDAPGPRS